MVCLKMSEDNYKWRIPRINPEISKKAIKYLQKNKISVEEFLDFIRLITMSEGALMRTYSGINITEPIGVYVDYWELNECDDRRHVMKGIDIHICFPNKTVEDKMNSITKLARTLYQKYPNIYAVFKLDHSCEWSDKAYPNLNAYFTSEREQK